MSKLIEKIDFDENTWKYTYDDGSVLIKDKKTGHILKGSKPTQDPNKNWGNPWLKELRASTSPEVWRQIVKRLQADAIKGDKRAVELLLKYTIPNPGAPPGWSSRLRDKQSIVDELQRIRTELALGNCDPNTANIYSRISALEKVVAGNSEGDRMLTINDINQALDSEVTIE